MKINLMKRTLAKADNSAGNARLSVMVYVVIEVWNEMIVRKRIVARESNGTDFRASRALCYIILQLYLKV